jgi:hypothetical protein
MGEASLEGWSASEQAIARAAFDRAYGRAIEQLVVAVQARSSGLDSAQTVWELHDFLSIQRHSIEGRFDFRLEGILFVFASLVKENLLDLSELSGLEGEKLAKITAMARF